MSTAAQQSTGVPTVPPRAGRHERGEHSRVAVGREDEIIDGRYKLGSLIGSGSFGEVWRAWDERLEDWVALKLLVPPAGQSTVPLADEERFRREARLTARFKGRHHIVPIWNFGEDKGRLFLVMPLLTGVDLQALLRGKGRMQPPRALRIARQIGDALGHAHLNGLVHRDVKPANVFVEPDEEEEVTLLDFGIMSAIDRALLSTITRRGQVVGTLAYMAPERFPDDDSEAPEPSSSPGDIYSLACIFYQCLTGTVPFHGDQYQLRWAHQNGDRPQPSAIIPSLTEFDAVIARGLAIVPSERQGSAADFVEEAEGALEAWLERQRTPERRTPPDDVDPAPEERVDPRRPADPDRDKTVEPPEVEPPETEAPEAVRDEPESPRPEPDAGDEAPSPDPSGTDEDLTPSPVDDPPGQPTWAPVLTGGGIVGIVGVAAVLVGGFSPVVDGVVIAGSWAAGAVGGWWYRGR